MTINNRHRSALLYILFALLFIAVLPLAGQDSGDPVETLTDENTILVVGEISFSTAGDIIVNAESGEIFIIAPAGAFTPSIIQAGDTVIIIGTLLPDGQTIQAISFELFVDDETDPEATPEATAEVTPEITPEATAEATPEITPEATEEPIDEPLATCGNPNHPVAARIAEEFEVSQEEVMAMHCAGNGFGNIARAFLLARAVDDGTLPQDFLDMHHNGQGWGNIVRGTGVHPSDLAPGRIGKGNDDSDETETTSTTQSGRGNGNGNGNNGNGNGNGRGNGNGNGNNGNGNNGNGNGRGNGKGG